jgi:hypothetical protein
MGQPTLVAVVKSVAAPAEVLNVDARGELDGLESLYVKMSMRRVSGSHSTRCVRLLLAYLFHFSAPYTRVGYYFSLLVKVHVRHTCLYL